MVNGQYNISRVIARPYQVTEHGLRRLSSDRRDFGIEPSGPTLLNRVTEKGGRVIGIGKIADLFVKSGVTHSIHTQDNQEGIDETIAAITGELNLDEIALPGPEHANPGCELIFTNLVDTDTTYGHRRDPDGYGRALEQIDQQIPRIVNSMRSEDLLIITSDHGNDPTAEGTDHTREYVPLLVTNEPNQPRNLGTIGSFAYVSKIVEQWLFNETN